MLITYYVDAAGKWRWRVTHDGRILARSGEAYEKLATMHADIERLWTPAILAGFEAGYDKEDRAD